MKYEIIFLSGVATVLFAYFVMHIIWVKKSPRPMGTKKYRKYPIVVHLEGRKTIIDKSAEER